MSRVKNLVTSEWLIKNHAWSDLKIFDATYFLATHKRDAKAEYLANHISGAIRFDIDSIKNPASKLPHMLPTAQQFEAHMQELGINNNDIVVVYDNSPFLSAARAWWLLRMFGHERVFVLDGGLKRFKAVGGKTESGVGQTFPKSNFKASDPIDTNVILFDELREQVLSGDSEQILDARSYPRFIGVEAEPREGLRGGHIPGSLNLPIASLLNSDTGEIVTDKQIKKRVADANIDLDRPIITTCGSGVTATGIALALCLIGVTGIKIYDGSWAEWGASSAPIAKD